MTRDEVRSRKRVPAFLENLGMSETMPETEVRDVIRVAERETAKNAQHQQPPTSRKWGDITAAIERDSEHRKSAVAEEEKRRFMSKFGLEAADIKSARPLSMNPFISLKAVIQIEVPTRSRFRNISIYNMPFTPDTTPIPDFSTLDQTVAKLIAEKFQGRILANTFNGYKSLFVITETDTIRIVSFPAHTTTPESPSN